MSGVHPDTVRSLLIGNAALLTLVSTRVFADVVPESFDLQAPHIVFNIASDSQLRTLRGSAGLRHAQIQVDAYAPGVLAAHAIADAVEVVLGNRHTYPRSLLLNRTATYEDATRLRRVSMDFSFWAKEA